MRIAILGWGSLVWDPRDLPHYGPWDTSGPTLNIEFSRVSSDGRLTLVLDPVGPAVRCRFAQSPRTAITDAVADLQARESTIRKHIGFVDATTGVTSRTEFPQQMDVSAVVRDWCREKGIDGCVWTALLGNFSEELNSPFSPENAVMYLERLGKSTRSNALKYIRNAPQEVDTPLRRAAMAKWPV